MRDQRELILRSTRIALSLTVCVFASLFLSTVCDNLNSTAQADVGLHISDIWAHRSDFANDTHIENGCNCNHFTCGCCSHLEQHEIHLNSTICSNVTYLSEDYGISFTVTFGDYVLFNETVSARNPPPVCAGAPYVEDLADVCVRLYDIQATKRSLHACASVEARMKHIRVAHYDLGCFNIGNKTLVEALKQLIKHNNDTVPVVVLV